MSEGMVIILISAALACGLSGMLAGLLVVAERYLVNYGTCKIDVNDGEREIEVEGGGSLLMTLKDNEIFIPSACGGKGTCAYCKVKITEGGGPLGPTEEPLLSTEEIANDVRISCQCKVRNDLRIAVPEELLSVREYAGVCERIRDLTHDIKEVRIKLTEPEEIRFVPGQYVQLEAPAYGDNPEPVFRAYSIASPPDEPNYLELLIRLVPGGICTTWVFEHLKEGDTVHFTGPFGEFRLSENEGPMIWIAGGSGMAPFWSIIRYMKINNLSRPATYFFGAVRKKDMFFVDELREFEKELDWFRFVPALSGSEEGSDWDGETGLITEVVDRHVEPTEGQEGYLCGSPGMIDASIKVLRRKDITEEQIFFDKFA
jgi:Na+-transporting NADH:ubiquinone oxidoreductase subunit F